MIQTFAPILDLLDQGFRLYRRGFVGLMLLTTLAALPLAVVTVLFIVAFEQVSASAAIFLIGVAFLLGLPLSLYAMGALSRAALILAAGEPLRVRRALAIKPLRVIGMGCYGTLFSLVAGMVVSMVSTVVVCGIYLILGAGVVAFSTLGSLSGDAVSETLLAIVFGLLFFAVVLLYAATLVVNGAVYGSTIYAMQPFVQDELSFGATVQRSIDLVGFRFGHNLLVFLCTSLVFATAALAVTLALGVLIPAPVLFLLGPESALAQAIAAVAWLFGVAATVPLLPIWMALLYGERRALREGEALAQALHEHSG